MLISDPSFCNKSLWARNKVAHVELLPGFARLRYAVTVTYRNQQRRTQKDFLSSEKKSNAKNIKYNNDFRKVVIPNQIPDALCNLRTSKYNRPHNKPNDGCLWKPAKHNSVRASKQPRFAVITETLDGNQALGTKCLMGFHWLAICYGIALLNSTHTHMDHQ